MRYLAYILFLFLSFSSFLQAQTAKIAILIDDVGARTATLTDFFEFNEKLNFAVLPFLAKSKECHHLILNSGNTSILHMPMESKGGSILNEQTKGLIKTNMPKYYIALLLDSAIRNLGGNVQGFNNHMGSKLTEHSRAIYDLLSLAKARNLYFIDSNTYTKIDNNGFINEADTAYSFRYAKALGVKTYYNSFFVDNLNTVENIEKVLLSSIKVAKEKGELLIIGHYRTTTATALKNVKAKMLSQGIEFVFVNELLK